jgi:hypothetical protein
VSRIFTRRASPWTLLGHWCEGTTLFRLQCEPKFSMSRSGPGNLPFLFVQPRLRGPFCRPRNLQSGMPLLLNPPWPSMTLNHKIPSHLRALYTHNLGILTFHCSRTQLWNQAHNRSRFSPFQNKLILSQKCRPSGRRSGKFLGAKSTSIRDCVRRSVGRLVDPSVPMMQLRGKLVTSQLLREEEEEEENWLLRDSFAPRD